MNRLRNIIIVMGASIILIMLLFPPFHVMYSPGIEIHKGYAFIFNSPPMFWDRIKSTVNMNLLSLQIGAVVILMVVTQLFFKIQSK
jgi:hypothetical protein